MESILNCEKSFAETVDAGIAEVAEQVPEGEQTRETCLYCRTKRKENVTWYSADYCSGKCKTADGGVITASADVDGESPESSLKQQEIAKLGSLLIAKRKEVVELNKLLEKLRDEKGDLLAEGLDTEENRLAYDDAYAKLKALESDIELIENKTIPRKHQEAAALKQAETSGVREELLLDKESIVSTIQDAFDIINDCTENWRSWCKESGVSLSQNQKNLFRTIVISDLTRSGLKRRISGPRIAKLSAYPD